MKLVNSFVSEFTYFWRSFAENWPEWIATICLALCSVVITITIQPKQRLTFYENFNERYPYQGETIGTPLVGVIIIIAPCLVLGILALVFPRRCELALAILSLAQTLCLTLLVTEALKVTVARPRPNFYSYCGYNNETKKCQGPSHHKRDSRLSFPSGHASNSFCSGTWMTLFLSSFFPKGEIWWLLIKFIPIAVATYVSSTRIIDHMHHVSDVISGAVLGIGAAIFVFLSQHPRIFMLNRKRLEDDEAPLDPVDEIL